MKNNRIRLTESQLHRVIKECVNRVLLDEVQVHVLHGDMQSYIERLIKMANVGMRDNDWTLLLDVVQLISQLFHDSRYKNDPTVKQYAQTLTQLDQQVKTYIRNNRWGID